MRLPSFARALALTLLLLLGLAGTAAAQPTATSTVPNLADLLSWPGGYLPFGETSAALAATLLVVGVLAVGLTRSRAGADR